MKYLLTIMMVLILAVPSWAMSWQDTNQVTIAWDAPTALSNGAPLPDGNTLSYVVYLAPQDSKTDKFEIGTTSQSEYTITVDTEGRYLVGVKAKRMDANGNKLSESIIAWSDNPDMVAGDQFGIVHFFSPSAVGGLQPITE